MATRPHDDDDTKKRDDDRRKAAPAAAAAQGAEAAGQGHARSRVTGAAAGADDGGAGSVSERTPEELAQMAANSIGAQIILDYNSDAALGARGGRGGTIEENTMARDADLIAVGLDPNAPSGPPTGQPWEPPVQVTRQATGPAATGNATRMSSLAAGAITDAGDLPDPPLRGQGGGGGGGGATAPVSKDVPHVSQSGETLNCTMGNWDGEPTSYGYQWKVDGTVVGTDAATYTVQAADVGKVATCIVTATNVTGSTAAPPSADVTIADPAGATRAKR
jgi:hypothetical protein